MKPVKHWREPHRDDLYEAEPLALTDVGREQHLYVHLERAAAMRELSFTCDDTPIN